MTFAFVSVTWIFFRANSLSDAWYVLTHMLDLDPSASYLSEGWLCIPSRGRTDAEHGFDACVRLDWNSSGA